MTHPFLSLETRTCLRRPARRGPPMRMFAGLSAEAWSLSLRDYAVEQCGSSHLACGTRLSRVSRYFSLQSSAARGDLISLSNFSAAEMHDRHDDANLFLHRGAVLRIMLFVADINCRDAARIYIFERLDCFERVLRAQAIEGSIPRRYRSGGAGETGYDMRLFGPPSLSNGREPHPTCMRRRT